MTLQEMEALFNDEEIGDEYLKFEQVQNKRHPRRDLHAFLLLEELAPGKPGTDLIAAADHDKFWLATNVEALAAAATRDHIAELISCGVHYDEEHEALAMFA